MAYLHQHLKCIHTYIHIHFTILSGCFDLTLSFTWNQCFINSIDICAFHLIITAALLFFFFLQSICIFGDPSCLFLFIFTTALLFSRYNKTPTSKINHHTWLLAVCSCFLLLTPQRYFCPFYIQKVDNMVIVGSGWTCCHFSASSSQRKWMNRLTWSHNKLYCSFIIIWWHYISHWQIQMHSILTQRYLFCNNERNTRERKKTAVRRGRATYSSVV